MLRYLPSRLGLLLLSSLHLGLVLAQSDFSTRFSPSERMSRERLAAAHAPVTALQKARRTLPPRAGLQDFRCILHAHAEDSTHTGGTRPDMLADAALASVHGSFDRG